MKSNLFLKTILAFSFSTCFSFLAHAELSENCQKLKLITPIEKRIVIALADYIDLSSVTQKLTSNILKYEAERETDTANLLAAGVAYAQNTMNISRFPYAECISSAAADIQVSKQIFGSSYIEVSDNSLSGFSVYKDDNNEIQFIYLSQKQSVFSTSANSDYLYMITSSKDKAASSPVMLDGQTGRGFFRMSVDAKEQLKKSPRVLINNN